MENEQDADAEQLSSPKRKLLEAKRTDAQIENEVRQQCLPASGLPCLTPCTPCTRLQTIEQETKQITQSVTRTFVDCMLTQGVASAASASAVGAKE